MGVSLGVSLALGAGTGVAHGQTVACWGDNFAGQSMVPSDLGAVISIAAGRDHTIAIKSDGTVRCWGDNGLGQCTVPSDLGTVSSIAGGNNYTIALKSDGTVRCWGDNGLGQCTVPSGLGAVTSVAGGAAHTIALKSDGTVRCWGYNFYGQCTVPSGLGPVGSIAGGWFHTIALKSDRTVRCWGDNFDGQCTVPSNLGPVMSVAGGAAHTIALKSDGTVRCWGDNLYGQCAVPSGLGPVTSIAGGDFHTIALKSDGTVRCWGDTFGGQCTVPSDLGTVRSVAGGGEHTVALAHGIGARPFGLVDLTFNPSVENAVFAVAIQTDGAVLVGGLFSAVNGVTRSGIARLHADGSLDTGFNAGVGGVFLSTVTCIAVQQDGKVILGGSFTTVNGVSRIGIARLNPNGSLDTGFNPSIGSNAEVLSLALQPDGKVLVGGSFTTVNGVPRKFIARLNSNGSVDTGFDPGAVVGSHVSVLSVQPDGKVLAGGDFSSMGGGSRVRIARLNSDGSLDTGFDPGAGANADVWALALQPDGKVLVGGNFTTIDGVSRNYIARLIPDGSLDAGFNPGTGANSNVNALALQPDGKLLVGGNFTTFNGVSRNYFARLNSNGSLDAGAVLGTWANGALSALALQPDGAVLAGGVFTTINGDPRNRIARLHGDCGSGDTDGDGIVDCLDGCPLDANLTAPIGYFADNDGDGFGAGSASMSCTAIAGSVTNAIDCNDAHATYADDDGDGFGAGSMIACGVGNNSDCNDSAALVYPDAPELCANLGIDNDCDGVNTAAEASDSIAYFADTDGDGFGAGGVTMSCSAVAGSVTNALDCNDANPSTHPGAAELCADTVDNDCDGVVNEGCAPFAVVLVGSATGIQPGNTFTVRASSSAPASAVSGAQFALHFDATVLRLDAVVPITGGALGVEIAESIDNTAGTLRYALGLTDPASPLHGGADLCDLVFTVLPTTDQCGATDLVQWGAVGPFTTRFTVAATGAALVPVVVPLGPVDIDTTPPVLSDVPPADIFVGADAGSTFGALVSLPPVAAVDACEGPVSITVTGAIASGLYPIGTTTVTWSATDSVGNAVSVSRDIVVGDYQLLDARISFNGVLAANAPRSIRVSAGASVGVHPVTVLAGTGGFGMIAGIVVPVATSYPCVAAKDTVHSLTRTAATSIAGARYEATFALVQGDSNNDDMIEIVDYATWVIDFGSGKAVDARSNFNADALVNNADLGFVSTGFFTVGESCTGGLAGARPRERISVKELRRAGLGELAAADLNRDGWFDLRDMQIAVQGNAGGNGGGAAAQPAAAEAAGVQW
jgi:uncharacterized delta-60 repeat protein